MKTYPNDDQLRQLLRRSWKASPKPNPDFRSAVWARIESAGPKSATWSGWLHLHLARVTLAAAVSIVLAGTGGGLLAATQASREREQLLQRYVMSIDPHQQVNAGALP